MHQPDSEHRIETTIEGEPVSGTVHHGGAWYISVRLDPPLNDWSTDLRIPIFARQAYREGFLGEYGKQRALELLVGLYERHKKGDWRRKFAGVDFKEFG